MSQTLAAQPTLSVGTLTLALAHADEAFDYHWDLTHGDGVDYATLHVSTDTPRVPPALSIEWDITSADMLHQWRSNNANNKSFNPDWYGNKLATRATANAPVIALHGVCGTNRLTFAVDDAIHPVTMQANIIEETGKLACRVKPFEGYRQAGTTFSITLRMDTRAVPYHTSLHEVGQWWASLDGFAPMSVPNIGKQPMYSTWYSFHQVLTSDAVEAQCKLAKAIGCEAVIVDDGWQTMDSNRGYAYTGDWEAERLTDIKASVERIHAMGLKYLLWYSVPFVGYESSVYARFKDKLLCTIDRLGCGVLDPRYPDVREYLINTYEKALNDWDLDGFKLDFVDSFTVPADGPISTADGRDMECAYEAADVLMADIADRLKAIKPDIMIEFRQSYIGPKMRRYGNLFRAGDCPLDAVRNRIATLDIRLLCGDTAAHSDMIMWHKDDSVENAARQLLYILFSVPQISVMLDTIPTSHVDMLDHYLHFWKANREVFLDGQLIPHHPEANYPTVEATTNDAHVIALYTTPFASLPTHPKPITHLINATAADTLVLNDASAYHGSATIYNCEGKVVSEVSLEGQDCLSLNVPVSGRVAIQSA